MPKPKSLKSLRQCYTFEQLGDEQCTYSIAAGATGEVVRIATKVADSDLEHVVDACLPALRKAVGSLGVGGEDASGNESE